MMMILNDETTQVWGKLHSTRCFMENIEFDSRQKGDICRIADIFLNENKI